MAYRSAIRPRCRCCGKLLAKVTERHSFGQAPIEISRGEGRKHVEQPATPQEAQRFLNGEITAVRYDTRAHIDAGGLSAVRTVGVPRYVSEVTVWDGETYADALFCSNGCAERFGRMAATNYPNLHTQAFADAIAKARAVVDPAQEEAV